LQPSVKIIITHHPEDVNLCAAALPPNVRFSVYAFSTDDNTKIFYQWYELDANGKETELLNNVASGYLGVNTQHLNISAVSSSYNGYGYYCRVWYFGDDPYKDGITSDTAYLKVGYSLTNISYPIINDTASIGSNISLAADENMNLSTSVITDIKWEYLESKYIGEDDDIIAVNTIQLPNNSLTLNINNASIYQSGMYTATVTTTCETAKQQFVVTIIPADGGIINSITEETNIELQISPNPANNFVNFIFSSTAEKNYYAEITDITGAIVYSFTGITKVNNDIKLDIEQLNLTSGSYIFNLLIDGKETTKSFVIAK
jgi:hypothetical protein